MFGTRQRTKRVLAVASATVAVSAWGTTVLEGDFTLTCADAAVEGAVLSCELRNGGGAAAPWPVVGVLHLSSDGAAEARLRGAPVDLRLLPPGHGAATDGGVWWTGDTLVGYERFDWDGDAEPGESRSFAAVSVEDDTDYEGEEWFYVAMAASGRRGIGFLYDSRQPVGIPANDTPSDDAGLNALSVSTWAEHVALAFSPDVLAYSVAVGYGVTEVLVSARASDARATVTVAGETPVRDGGVPVPLGVGPTTVEVRVTAEDGSAARTYSVTLTRAERTPEVTVVQDGFELVCPASASEGEQLACMLRNNGDAAAEFPAVAVMHSSADADRALVAPDSSGVAFARDVRLDEEQSPPRERFQHGYGDLFAGPGTRRRTVYGFEKFDWSDEAAPGASRDVMISVLADDLDEAPEIFYLALAPGGYAGLSRFVRNKRPVVIENVEKNAPPAFSSAASFEAPENEAAVGTVIAADPDAGDVVGFAVTGGADAALLSIGATTGELAFGTAPDYESPADVGADNAYEVVVTATGGIGSRALSTDQAVTVHVTDVLERVGVSVATIAADAGAVSEGAPASFTATLSEALGERLTVAVAVVQEGAFVAGEAPASVTFGAGETRAVLRVETDDDAVVEDDGSVTATLEAGAGYAVGEPSSATVVVTDGDEADYRMSAEPVALEEGGSAALRVWIANGVTHASDLPVEILVDGEVDASDYALVVSTETLEAGSDAFTATLTALEDGVEEQTETVRLSARIDGATRASAQVTIAGEGVQEVGSPTQRSALFGDLHIHTAYSYDAYDLNGERKTPEDAYRYAKGEAVGHVAGGTVQLSGPPLDFLAVTDHAEWLGMDMRNGTWRCAYGANKLGDTCQNEIRDGWRRVIAAAERHNDPGNFTTLIGYEYGSNWPANKNRNVIFKSADVPDAPFSAWHSRNPQRLWDWMDEQRVAGRDSLAIPHNSNLSNGEAFPRTPWQDNGRTSDVPMDSTFAAQRARNEPVVEVYQNKGASEVHPRLWPNDEWADFQIRSGAHRGSYWRGALNTGLELEEELGVNPFQAGAIGASDSHVVAGSYEEDAYFTNRSTTAEQRTEVFLPLPYDGRGAYQQIGDKALNGTGGLTGIWAEENTRASLFEALRRRETFGTSGPRIQVRLFGGFGLAGRLAGAEDEIAAAYANGVPMGGTLAEASAEPPGFLVWALRDPNAGRLQRLQVVKGWLEGGLLEERVIDVACSDGLVPDAATGRCPDNGAEVDLTDCSVSSDKGAGEIRTVWTDPDFELGQRSYYYVRVLENPSCRWSTWDAVRRGLQPHPDLPETHQERAWSSPIWVYGVPPGTRLASMSLSGVDIGTFLPEELSYEGHVDFGTGVITVRAGPWDTKASVSIEPADADALEDGHQVLLAVGANNKIAVTVTAWDGETTRTYTVTVTRAASDDARLSALSLSGVDLGGFDAETTAYAGAVAHDVTVTTVAAAPRDANARVEFAPADADPGTPGHQVAFAVGENTVTVTVTAQNGIATRTVTAVVTRSPAPTVTIVRGFERRAAGQAATFFVKVSAPQPRALEVAVAVDDEGGVVSGEAPGSVRVAPGLDDGLLRVATDAAGMEAERGSVTATVEAGAWYAVGEPSSATVMVDAASFRMTAAPAALEEGGSASVRLWIDNGATLGADMPVEFRVTGDVTASDYEVDGPAALRAGETELTATFGALEDGAAEATEGLRLAALVDGWERGAVRLTIDDAERPTVTGAAQVGATLEARAAAGPSADASYQWLRDGAAVAGATGPAHALTAADAGARLSVRVSAGGRTVTSLPTIPIWPAPGNPPVGVDEKELLGTLLTVGSTDAYRLRLGGYGRLSRASFGALEGTELGAEVEVKAAFVNEIGEFALVVSQTPEEEFTVYWNGHRIGRLSSAESGEGAFLRGATPQPRDAYLRYVDGRSDGVRAALSVRRALPAPVVSVAALSESVAEGEEALFEVTLDRATGAPVDASVEVTAEGDVLSGDAPVSATVPAGETRALLRVATDDDRVVEGDGSVTATVTAGEGYALGETLTATVAVEDGDAATFAARAVPAEIPEGGEARLTIAVEDGVTFAVDRTLVLAVSGQVAESDYELDASTLVLAAGGSSVQSTFAALADDVEEEVETAAVAALLDGDEVASAAVSIRPLSAEARLAALSLTEVDIGAFDAKTTAYQAAVPNAVSATTVTAEPADANAAVAIADAAGSTLGTERTTQLATGPNEIAATVTAEDGATERSYAVTVTRAEPPWGTHLPERDIALGGSGESTGVWSDGETLWALADWDSGRARAYKLATGARLAARDLRLESDYTQTALFSDNETLWAASFYGGARAYRLADGSRLAERDLDAALSAAGNDRPSGLWSDGSIWYVANLDDARLYAYAADGTRLESLEFGFRTGDVQGGWPWGLWSDGETLLTSWHGRGRVLAYRLADGARLPERDIHTGAAGNDDPRDVWSDGETLWVVDGADRKLYAYAAPGLVRPASSGLLPVRVTSRALAVPAAEPGRPVAIPDAGLRGRIAAALGKAPDAPLGAHELLALESLDARGAGVADLAGLEHAANLVAIDLGENPLVDLRPLAALAQLEALNLDATGADAWAVAALGGLTRLSLRDNGVGDVSALGALTRLRALDLAGNVIEDVTPLGGLVAVEALDLRGNPVTDLAPLAALPALVRLDADSGSAASGSGRSADEGRQR